MREYIGRTEETPGLKHGLCKERWEWIRNKGSAASNLT